MEQFCCKEQGKNTGQNVLSTMDLFEFFFIYLVNSVHACTSSSTNTAWHPAAPLEGTQGTTGCHGTLVENHWLLFSSFHAQE